METTLQTSVLILGAQGLQVSLTFPVLNLLLTLSFALLVMNVPEFTGNKSSDLPQKPVSQVTPDCLAAILSKQEELRKVSDDCLVNSKER